MDESIDGCAKGLLLAAPKGPALVQWYTLRRRMISEGYYLAVWKSNVSVLSYRSVHNNSKRITEKSQVFQIKLVENYRRMGGGNKKRYHPSVRFLPIGRCRGTSGYTRQYSKKIFFVNTTCRIPSFRRLSSFLPPFSFGRLAFFSSFPVSFWRWPLR